MFEYAAFEVIGHAHIKCAGRAAHDVHVIGSIAHFSTQKDRDSTGEASASAGFTFRMTPGLQILKTPTA
jgi:hypothetical protein